MRMWSDKNHRREFDRTMSMTDLKMEVFKDLSPCPFCGCTLKDYAGLVLAEKFIASNVEEYRVTCPYCGASGPGAKTLEWAATCWESRDRECGK